MNLLQFLLNVLWIAFGGIWMSVAWVIAGIIMAITIIGLPWAPGPHSASPPIHYCPSAAEPFRAPQITGRDDFGTGPLGLLGNILWLVLAGWWLALGHVITAAMWAVTIVGLPFAWAHLKLAGIALWPIGKIIVPANA
ncbi:MAG: YccF domain-containing protein [Methylovirgula sp.]